MSKEEKCNKCGKPITADKSFCDECWTEIVKNSGNSNDGATQSTTSNVDSNSCSNLKKMIKKYGRFSYLLLMNKGRIPRTTYNEFSIALFVIGLVLFSFLYALFDEADSSSLTGSMYYGSDYYFIKMLDRIKTIAYLSPLFLAFGYFQAMLASKRLHDLNLSAGHIMIIVGLGAIPGLNLIVWIGYSLMLMCVPGTKGDNNFGADPNGVADVDAES